MFKINRNRIVKSNPRKKLVNAGVNVASLKLEHMNKYCWYLLTAIFVPLPLNSPVHNNGKHFFRFRLVLSQQVPAISTSVLSNTGFKSWICSITPYLPLMFSQAVCDSVQGGCGRYPPVGRYTPGQTTPLCRHTPPGRQPPGQTPPPRDGYCSGRYASYWNAFLLIRNIKLIYSCPSDIKDI